MPPAFIDPVGLYLIDDEFARLSTTDARALRDRRRTDRNAWFERYGSERPLPSVDEFRANPELIQHSPLFQFEWKRAQIRREITQRSLDDAHRRLEAAWAAKVPAGDDDPLYLGKVGWGFSLFDRTLKLCTTYIGETTGVSREIRAVGSWFPSGERQWSRPHTLSDTVIGYSPGLAATAATWYERFRLAGALKVIGLVLEQVVYDFESGRTPELNGPLGDVDKSLHATVPNAALRRVKQVAGQQRPTWEIEDQVSRLNQDRSRDKLRAELYRDAVAGPAVTAVPERIGMPTLVAMDRVQSRPVLVGDVKYSTTYFISERGRNGSSKSGSQSEEWGRRQTPRRQRRRKRRRRRSR